MEQGVKKFTGSEREAAIKKYNLAGVLPSYYNRKLPDICDAGANLRKYLQGEQYINDITAGRSFNFIGVDNEVDIAQSFARETCLLGDSVRVEMVTQFAHKLKIEDDEYFRFIDSRESLIICGTFDVKDEYFSSIRREFDRLISIRLIRRQRVYFASELALEAMTCLSKETRKSLSLVMSDYYVG